MSPSDSEDDNVEDVDFDNEDAELEAEDDSLDIGPGEATEEVRLLVSLSLPHFLPMLLGFGSRRFGRCFRRR